MEDAARAELPLSPSHQETHPVGMALDTSPQYNLPWGENQQLPPMPLLLLLSHEGLLTLYWCVNLQPASIGVCVPPTPLPDTSGLHLFSYAASASDSVQQQTPPTPVAAVVNTPPASLASSAPMLFAPPTPAAASTPAATFSYGGPATIAPTGQWQQPPTSSQPAWTVPALSAAQPENKSTSSWMSSPSLPQAFVASVTPTSAFSLAPAASTPTQPTFAAQPVSFALADSFGKPAGAFVQSAVSSPKSIPEVTSVAPVQTQAKLDIPAASFPVQPPPAVPIPEPEVTEESEHLRKMNEALIQDSIREEISFCDKEIQQLSQRVHSLKINVLNDVALERLTSDTEEMLAFMRELKETTDVQGAEVEMLRNFILQSFSYLESMKTRLRLQNNPDYMSIQTSQGLDPIQARRMDDIRTNIQLMECQLRKLNQEIVERWGTFQEANKENREVLHIPSLEAIFQAMVMQNNVISKQKNLIHQLEGKVKLRDRKRVLALLNVSRIVDDIEAEHKETDVSKIANDFLSLNLKKLTKDMTVEELQESVADFSLSNFTNNPNRDMSSEQAVLVQQLFSDSQIKHLNVNKNWSSPPPVLGKLSPRLASTSQTSSVTFNTPKTLSAIKDVKQAAMDKDVKLIKTVEDSRVKSPFSVPTSASTTSNFNLGTKNQNLQILSPLSFISNSSLQNTQAVSPSSVGLNQYPTENRAAWVCSSCKSPESLSSGKVYQPVSTQPVTAQSVFVPQTPTATNGFSFAPVTTTQPSQSFLAQPSAFGATSPMSQPDSQPFVPFSKTFTFATTVSTTTTSNVLFTTNFKTETPKSLSPSSLSSTPFKVAASESGFDLNVTSSPVTVPTSPLAALSNLVSGIEPLKLVKESPIRTQATGEMVKPTVSQPFIFKVPSESKTSPSKDIGITPLKNVPFSFTMENKQEGKDGSPNNSENKTQFSGALKKLSFESSPPKSIFGGIHTPVTVTSDAEKSDQTTKNVLSFSNTTSSSFFSTSNTGTVSPQTQKPIFGFSAISSSVASSPPVMQVKPVDTTDTGDAETESTSPVIEVYLKPSNNGNDSKSSLEKLESSKGITITKVSPEKKFNTEVPLTEAETATPSLFGPSSFTTPTKPTSNIFGGSSPTKPSVMYEVPKPELQSTQEQKLDKTVEEKKEQDTSKPTSIFGGAAASTTTPAPTFSFSNSTFQTGEATQPSTGFSFGLKTLVSPSSTSSTLTSALTSSQATSTFSFTQPTATTLPASSSFTFSLSTPSSTTSTSSTFGLGDLSSALSSDDKTKSAFSFGQQTKTTAATSTSSIFGGFGVKASETTATTATPSSTTTTAIFGQTPAAPTIDQNKSIFGETSSSSNETKTVFGQTPSSSSETKSIFGQTPSSAGETKSIFGTVATSSDSKNIFGTTVPTAETKSIFGAPATSSENKSIFGTIATGTDTKNIFGTPTTTSETKSIFGTPSTTSETKDIFGQPASTENKNIFGQTSVSSVGTTKTDFSFSLSTPSTGGQTSFFGTPTTSSTSFFGQQICSPTTTASSPFGQQTTSASVFGSPAPSPFGSSSTFGQSGGSLFGSQSGGGFGTSGGSMFGGGFGSSQSASPFGSSTGTTGSIFGGGSFSSGGQSVGQTGFGTPAFQSKPAFGSTSPQPAFGAPPAFGAAPTFGGSPAFGSPPKLFGSPTAPAAGFGSTQQSSTFENLANQNTMTFGNLAQNQAPAFGSSGGGSLFGGGQQQQSTAPAFAPATTSSSFGGSSFTSWR